MKGLGSGGGAKGVMISMSSDARDRTVDTGKDGIDKIPLVGVLCAAGSEGIGKGGESVDEIAGDDDSRSEGDERG